MTFRVLVADDHPITLEGISLMIKGNPDCQWIGSAKDGRELMAKLSSEPCDVLITDYVMPKSDFHDGISLLELIRRHHPDLKVIVLTMLDHSALLSDIRSLGVHAIISKLDPLSHIRSAIEAVCIHRCAYFSPAIKATLDSYDAKILSSDGNALSMRERDVLRLFSSGKTVGDIANSLNRSIKTISAQKVSAMRKLGVKNDVELLELLRTRPGEF
ncbi:response regulator transcription factor [Burkholderia cenocepacia]|uniref:response regulator transcription factor n=1 Tax=Burkholderia cenocepacia TaxID=95486 RepID=UPI001BAC8747|nr:response regulator transcription factor [Burkholderia cenocepacia]QUN38666.1 response regulator transcription factor [Burkholderia cenocepacia]QUO29430.1 response regulator transcription factor [Burkholderia cenocepacia]